MTRRVPLPSPDKELTWAEQMALERIGENKYRSLAGTVYGAFTKKNGEQRPRAYGGHVYAQAVYAASKTVGKEFLIHSVTGYFTVVGLADEPFTFDVQVVRTGRGYSVRSVTVRQEGDPTICFTCLCSFKRTEHGFINVQKHVDIGEKYAQVMEGKEVEDLTVERDVKDWRVAMASLKPSISPFFPGLHISILPLERVHKPQRPLKRKNLYFFSANSEPSADPDYNLEACAHLYHSDRESIWSILRQYELLDVLEVASSLSHTVIFHVGGDDLTSYDKQGRKRWFYQETKSKRVSDGRALHQGKIFNREGVLVASTMQDGALKLKALSEAEVKRRERRLNDPPKL